MTTIVLSAHLDDGVLSASHVLAQEHKREAVSAYRLQVPGLRLTHRWNDLLDHEACWQPN